MDSYREIYPQLPTEGNTQTGEDYRQQPCDNFRLKQCADWLSLLEKDLQDCEKYTKSISVQGAHFSICLQAAELFQ